MMDHGLLWLLMIMSCLSLAGLGMSGVLVSKAQKLKAKREARMAAASSPHVRAQPVVVSAFIKAPRKRDQSLPALAAAVFGFDLDKPELHPAKWWIILIATLVVGKVAQSLAAGLMGNISWFALPVVWVGTSRYIFGAAAARRKHALLRQFPDALAMIVRSVRVGIPVLEAVRAVARETPEPTGPEFARLVDQVSIGVAIDEAVLEMADRCGISEYRFFATALTLQNQTGGTLSETLENLADVIRKRVALAAKGKALASEGRTSAMVLGALPVVTGLGMWALNPQYMGTMFTDPTGRKLFGAAVLSLSLGIFTIRTIIRKSLA
ncbi:MAG TPA: type II secretion system F family protein [Acetobacteraceae bacterium]|nr:type II secretion system F family protein [Acetobacteraceae bacterium]HUN42574.1 type II secretion system F family protein [Acetobacteraceae bacterium]